MREVLSRRPRRPRRLALGALAVNLLTGGCAASPSINVLGAYFPEWMFCIVGGVSVAVLLRAWVTKTRYARWLGPAPIVYPACALLFALLIWLISFQR